ncbi:uncharacterized protein LOC117115382, partial [Anneissia japonica]|uniref:uncharacterized protein LOC117115382 n=1 Tax=Anneissia japonica TaxID=1529436 RepID=UPI0014258DAB
MEYQHEGNVLFEAIGHRDWQEARLICEEHPHLINTHRAVWNGETPLLHAMTRKPPAPEDLMLLMVEKATVGNIEYENPVEENIMSHLAMHMYTSALRCALKKSPRKIIMKKSYSVFSNLIKAA